jgi:hypothetical protein
MTTTERTASMTGARVGLAAATVLLVAAMVYEMVAHGGFTYLTGPVGLIGPDLAFLAGIGQQAGHGLLPRRAVGVYNLVHRPWLPLILVLVVSLDGQTNAQAAPYFVAGLGWLAHITMDRAAGFRLRAKDGSIRSAGR